MPLDLTPFGFTPTESLVYEILVTRGPGTGYAIARSAGLARANAYAALEGLVSKGAARGEDGRPRRFRPEPPPLVLARIVDRQSQAVDHLTDALEAISVPVTPTLTEVTSLRSAAHLLLLEVGRARERVSLLLPTDTWPGLGPALRRAQGAGVSLELYADGDVAALVAPVTAVTPGARWPGRPLLAAIDGRMGMLGSADGDRVTAHWGTAPALVAAASLSIRALAGQG
jgi:sugar-specific transcriptional regulator TrmB